MSNNYLCTHQLIEEKNTYSDANTNTCTKALSTTSTSVNFQPMFEKR